MAKRIHSDERQRTGKPPDSDGKSQERLVFEPEYPRRSRLYEQGNKSPRTRETHEARRVVRVPPVKEDRPIWMTLGSARDM